MGPCSLHLEVQGRPFLATAFKGPVWLSGGHQFLFSLTRRFSEWSPWASRVSIIGHFWTCQLSPAPDLLNHTLGWARPAACVSQARWVVLGSLRFEIIGSCPFSLWRHEQTQLHCTGPCSVHQPPEAITQSGESEPAPKSQCYLCGYFT